ncbi:MAG: AMP-binding protein [Acidimicrobiia bacterium]|nr:AMP-binding protein [Acidimicrobiia bacterium]
MADLLTSYAALQPDKVAVIDDRPGMPIQTLTYAELEARANRLANVLLEQGVGPGTTCVWCGQNSLGVVVFVNAARKVGAVSVPLNYRLSDDEAEYVTDHCDATLVYVDAAHAPMFERIRERLPKVSTYLVYDAAFAGLAVPKGLVDADKLMAAALPEAPDGAEPGATMIYTSGTTGKPKGALRQGVGNPAQIGAMVQHIGYTPDDVYLTTGPLYHSGPGGFMAVAQALGQTVVVQHKFDPQDWLRLVERYRCTSTFAAPTPIRMICNLPKDVRDRYDHSSMRIMIANAAPWSMALKEQYIAEFGNDSLFEVYGSTELGVNTILRPEDQLRKPGSCGIAAPLVEVQLYDDQGQQVTDTGPSAVGELYVRSPSVFVDYYKQHDKYEEDHRQGFQTVGDIAYRDDEGFLYICDRKKDMIISGGMNIYPAEIEAALELNPDVYEAAAFGIPDDDWGELVHAVIVARPGSVLTREAVTEHARQHLAGYKVPRSVSWSDELPKTGSGKILKRELRAPFWADRATNV